MTLVEQIMKTPRDLILTSDTIEHAIRIVLDRPVATCPVVDTSGRFLGQLKDSSLIQAVLLKSSGKNIKFVYDLKESFVKSQKISRMASLNQLISKVFDSPSQRVFVVDSTNRLLGLISPKDVLMFLMTDLDFKIDQGPNNQSGEEKLRFKNGIEKLRSGPSLTGPDGGRMRDFFEDDPNLFIAFNSALGLSYANKFARKILGIKTTSSKMNLNNIFYENSSRQITELMKSTSSSKAKRFKRGYYSIKSSDGKERRFEMALSCYPPSKDSKLGETRLSCVGRPLNVDMLLKQLKGVFNEI